MSEPDALEAAGKADLLQKGLLATGLPPNNIPVKGGWGPLKRFFRRLSDKWYETKVEFGLAIDWNDPDNAFPSLSPSEPPHAYIEMPDLKCCPRCGGGRKHKIHEVK